MYQYVLKCTVGCKDFSRRAKGPLDPLEMHLLAFIFLKILICPSGFMDGSFQWMFSVSLKLASHVLLFVKEIVLNYIIL